METVKVKWKEEVLQSKSGRKIPVIKNNYAHFRDIKSAHEFIKELENTEGVHDIKWEEGSI